MFVLMMTPLVQEKTNDYHLEKSDHQQQDSLPHSS
jgi:hypothetical protein